MAEPIHLEILGTGWIAKESAQSLLQLSNTGQEATTIERPFEGNGHQFEAAKVMKCLRANKLEGDLMPLDETLSIMQTMNAIRAQWGLKYPMERIPETGHHSRRFHL